MAAQSNKTPTSGNANPSDDHFIYTLEDKRYSDKPGERFPKLEKVVRDNKSIQNDMQRIWWESDPYADPSQRREMGLYLRRNSSGDVWTVPFSKPGKRGPDSSGVYHVERDVRGKFEKQLQDICDWISGEQTLATIHTHVANPLRKSSQPSPDDRNIATKTGVQGIIVAPNGQYYYGPPGKFPEQQWRPWGSIKQGAQHIKEAAKGLFWR